MTNYIKREDLEKELKAKGSYLYGDELFKLPTYSEVDVEGLKKYEGTGDIALMLLGRNALLEELKDNGYKVIKETPKA